MSVKVNGINLLIDESLDLLKIKTAKVLKINKEDIKNIRLYKKSLDLRRKNDIKYVCSVIADLDIDEKRAVSSLPENKVSYFEKQEYKVSYGKKTLTTSPVIIGSGPAGLFAGFNLAINGYKPIIIERGSSVKTRQNKISMFEKTGIFSPDNNVQFGEGGAGMYSDGKLTTRINDKRCDYVIDTFVKYGAPDEISYQAKPHIGTDNLSNILISMRKEIEKNGGKYFFDTKVVEIVINSGKVSGIKTDSGEYIESQNVILATGHSARDIYRWCYNNDISIQKKPFSLGFRIEHPQEYMDKIQYGESYKNPNLGPSEYNIHHKNKNRTIYSFCMCPGGMVVNGKSEENTIVTNGMSYFKRNMENANSAICVSVFPEDFDKNPLSGMYFQESIEKKAYEMTKFNLAPCMTLEGFVKREKKSLKGVIPSIPTGYELAKIWEIYPDFINDNLNVGFENFDKYINGFYLKDAVLTGPETRTSAPLRILRDENYMALYKEGLYPCGEGAGYAGGIMSSAVDGLKVSEAIMKEYKPIIGG